MLVCLSEAIANAIRFEPERGGHDATGQVIRASEYSTRQKVSSFFTKLHGQKAVINELTSWRMIVYYLRSRIGVLRRVPTEYGYIHIKKHRRFLLLLAWITIALTTSTIIVCQSKTLSQLCSNSVPTPPSFSYLTFHFRPTNFIRAQPH